MKRSRQQSLFGTLLPRKQKFTLTGEIFSAFDLQCEETQTTITINEKPKDILFEERYFAGYDLIGHDQAKLLIKSWDCKLKPLLVIGKSGIGKTCFVKGFFKGYSVWDESFLEENETLHFSLHQLLDRKSLFQNKRCILIDCLDGFNKNELQDITKALKRKEYFIPVVLTCDDEYELPKDLKTLCYQIKLQDLKYSDFKLIISNVIEKEQLKIQNNMLENLYESCFGNVRFALNELQFLLQTRKRKLLSNETSLAPKDIKFDLFKSTQSIFNGIQLKNSFLNECGGELNILQKMVFENSYFLQDPVHWEFLSWCDVLEREQEDMSLYLLLQSTILRSRKIQGQKQIRFPTSYFNFEKKREQTRLKLKKSGESWESLKFNGLDKVF